MLQITCAEAFAGLPEYAASVYGFLAMLAMVPLLQTDIEPAAEERSIHARRRHMKIQYLEIVTPEVDAVCAAYASAAGVEFGAEEPTLGNARTAEFPGGGWVGVRGPMHEAEEPVVRPYWLVEDIQAAWAAALKAGAQEAHPPMEIPGRGTFAIYVQGGVHHGLWQL